MNNLKRKPIDISESLATNLPSILESLSEGLILADDQGLLFYTNSKFAEITGFSQEEMIGKRVYELFHTESELKDKELIAAMHKRYQDRMRGISETYEIKMTRKDGESRWLEISAGPLRDTNGKIIGSIGLNTDITKRKELESQLQLSQKMEVVGRLAGGLAHDFNNLLTVISGYANILSSVFQVGEKSFRHVEAIKEASKMASALTKQLLTVSRKQILQLETVDLNKIVVDSLSILQNLVGTNVTISLKLEENLPPILADISQIQQILINLVLNSRDAMRGDGRLSIKTYTINQKLDNGTDVNKISAGNYAVLSVTDNGTGITDKVKKHLFEPFFTTKKKGNGLGLSTVYGIIGQHNGSVSVKSEVGVFTTFEIFLPLSENPLIEKNKETKRDRTPTTNNGTESILLVEDETEVNSLIKEILEDQGYKITSTLSGKEAIEIFEERPYEFDLLISDVVMPEVNGFQVIEKITQLNPKIRIILMSGCVQDLNVPTDLKSSKIPFILKPFTMDSMSQKVRLILDDRLECPILAKALQEI
jgi:two-component system cell cycle sensor histidine kinase/response regulator CckA